MKKNLIITLVGTALLAVSATTTANAGHHGDKMFSRIDSDNNGIITKEEFTLKMNEKFTKMDLNDDGTITKDEAKAHHLKKKHHKMHRKGKCPNHDDTTTQEDADHTE